MKTFYVCNDCGTELSLSEFNQQSDIFCSECGGQIEEIIEEATTTPIEQPEKIKHPVAKESTFRFRWTIRYIIGAVVLTCIKGLEASSSIFVFTPVIFCIEILSNYIEKWRLKNNKKT